MKLYAWVISIVTTVTVGTIIVSCSDENDEVLVPSCDLRVTTEECKTCINEQCPETNQECLTACMQGDTSCFDSICYCSIGEEVWPKEYGFPQHECREKAFHGECVSVCGSSSSSSSSSTSSSSSSTSASSSSSSSGGDPCDALIQAAKACACVDCSVYCGPNLCSATPSVPVGCYNNCPQCQGSFDAATNAGCFNP